MMYMFADNVKFNNVRVCLKGYTYGSSWVTRVGMHGRASVNV